ncbi:MAG: helicase-related protein [Sulfolobales archaeon]
MHQIIKEGSIVKGPLWPEPIEVKKIEEIDEYVRVIGVTLHSRRFVDQLISKSDYEKLEVEDVSLDFSTPSEEAFLAIEAERYRFASLFDPLLAMNVSKIDPLPFQIEAVYGYILKLPKVRFLLADDPGAGKTIMAGLVHKELKLRGVVNRTLIVVPGHLKDQWLRELKEKFHEHFTIIDRSSFYAHYGENPWERENQVITSMDFAKQDDILLSLQNVDWDLVIVDEAHKMAAYKYGDKISKTERYKLGEVLSRNASNLLFLTATPHKGDPENFRLFLDLLSPGFFATTDLIYESLKNKDNPLFIRRMKEDLRDFEGRPIFTNRYPKTIKFILSDKETELYNELSKYVITQYNLALERIQEKRRRNIAFALLILQRRMASSTYALLKSLKRRKQRLEELLEKSELPKEEIEVDLEEVEDYEEKERWEHEKRWETVSIAANKQELRREIETIDNLIKKAEEIIREECEVKLQELKKAIEEGFKKIREIGGNEKILIFTESKDTMEYLVKKLQSWGYLVNYMHGGMSLEERIRAEKIFRDKTQIMVSTEAGGEGINLQFCHLMINYDIPWNPNRLEQRMGRIHRYGQQKDVYVFNLVAENTREGKVLIKLLDKLDEIRRALGSDKVFDVIGDIFYGKNLYQLILEAVANTRSIDEIIKELDVKIDENYIRKIKEALGESLATRHIDYTRIREMAEKAKEYRLIPEYVEEFFKKAMELAGGKFRVRKDGFLAIESVPYEIRKLADDVNFKNKYGIVLKEYPKVTFDKELAFKNPDAEFISFGHPLLEALLEWIEKNFSHKLRRGAVFEDPSGRYNGILWFFEVEVRDGKGEVAGKKLITVYDNGENLQEVNPAIIWDLVPSKEKGGINVEKPVRSKEEVEKNVIRIAERYKGEILLERSRQAEVKKRYGVRSLQYLISELDADLAELYERQARGEKVEIAIRNKEERKKRYEEALRNLKLEIDKETSLTISMPRFVGAIYVKPVIKAPEMVSDEEVERIGMQIAMEYERRQGREPEDVSKENLGFDIRSRGKNEIRYIEVKARAGIGPVALTQNEWFKARRFKEQYWLYVVLNAAKKPELIIINNPAENLKYEERIEVVRFLIPLDELINKGVRA